MVGKMAPRSIGPDDHLGAGVVVAQQLADPGRGRLGVGDGDHPGAGAVQAAQLGDEPLAAADRPAPTAWP